MINIIYFTLKPDFNRWWKGQNKWYEFPFINVDRANSPKAMTGFPFNGSMYATKTTGLKHTSTNGKIELQNQENASDNILYAYLFYSKI